MFPHVPWALFNLSIRFLRKLADSDLNLPAPLHLFPVRLQMALNLKSRQILPVLLEPVQKHDSRCFASGVHCFYPHCSEMVLLSSSTTHMFHKNRWPHERDSHCSCLQFTYVIEVQVSKPQVPEICTIRRYWCCY